MINEENLNSDFEFNNNKSSSIDYNVINKPESFIADIIACSLCSRIFTNLTLLKNHLKRMHSSLFFFYI